MGETRSDRGEEAGRFPVLSEGCRYTDDPARITAFTAAGCGVDIRVHVSGANREIRELRIQLAEVVAQTDAPCVVIRQGEGHFVLDRLVTIKGIQGETGGQGNFDIGFVILGVIAAAKEVRRVGEEQADRSESEIVTGANGEFW